MLILNNLGDGESIFIERRSKKSRRYKYVTKNEHQVPATKFGFAAIFSIIKYIALNNYVY